MATCPRCGGFLNEHHHCVGLWRLRLRAWGAVLVGGIVGGLAGMLLLSGFNREASWLSITLTALLGMIIVVAMRPYNTLR
jgi:predicted lipid-binding transport protein (Tim44 family)